MLSEKSKYEDIIAGLVNRARTAQSIAEFFTQEKVDELVTAIAWAAVKDENAKRIANLAYEESKMGNYESKYAKMQKKPRGVLNELKKQKSVGIIEKDETKGIIKIAKPVGVIGVLIPCTNPEITPVIKAMNAIKGRNAVIYSPHPRTKKTTYEIVEIMREVLRRHGAPEDLLICIEKPDIEMSNELMRQVDLVIATGGANMVKAAYSSGTPAFGVGVGNVVTLIDETADIEDAAMKIMKSKMNDLSSGCSSENSLLINNTIYNKFLKALVNVGGYIVDKKQKEKLQNAMWPEGHLSKDIITQPAATIAKIAGIEIDNDSKFIIVEESGVGKEYPFSGEKLSVVLAVYKYTEIKDAIKMANSIQAYSGAGHSCGIHSFDDEHIMELALSSKTSRIMVRQGQNVGNSGDWGNGMPWTVTLGCGTWGGNITSENITFKHFINTTWVSFPIKPNIPSDEELFGDIMKTE